MKQGTIKIAATMEGWYPVDGCEFEVTISKGSIEYSLEFYGTVDEWKAFGARLITFPHNPIDRIGFHSVASTTYLGLEAYCYDEKGHSALAVTMGENADEPFRCQLNFSILAEGASINRRWSKPW